MSLSSLHQAYHASDSFLPLVPNLKKINQRISKPPPYHHRPGSHLSCSSLFPPLPSHQRLSISIKLFMFLVWLLVCLPYTSKHESIKRKSTLVPIINVLAILFQSFILCIRIGFILHLHLPTSKCFRSPTLTFGPIICACSTFESSFPSRDGVFIMLFTIRFIRYHEFRT